MINVLSKFNFQVLLERATAFCSKELFNPNGGGVDCAQTFLDGYFSMKKGVWKSQISWLFLIPYEIWENQNFWGGFHSVLGVI